ncbi:hypothetical protein LWI29_014873 [Acer saccharum]|uniref:Uncharacterized protein n=1 Tax=Acer saccharum TaxID=4024 RepID=A0AA39V8I0_ACESA|nr:hypothetical protein LWI29_014873 [Acer saccharum]
MKVLGEIININIFNSSELLGAVDCFTIYVIESRKLPNSPIDYLDELLAILDEEEEVHVKEAPKEVDELRSQKVELILERDLLKKEKILLQKKVTKTVQEKEAMREDFERKMRVMKGELEGKDNALKIMRVKECDYLVKLDKSEQEIKALTSKPTLLNHTHGCGSPLATSTKKNVPKGKNQPQSKMPSRSSGPGRHSGANLGGRDEGVRYRSPQNSSTGGSGNVWRAKTGGDGSFQQGSSSKSQPDSDAACLRSIAVGSNADGGEDCNQVEFAVGADPIFFGELQGRHEIGKQVLHQVGMVSGVVHEFGKSTMAEPRRLDKDGSGMLHDVSVTQVSGSIYFGLRDQGVMRRVGDRSLGLEANSSKHGIKKGKSDHRPIVIDIADRRIVSAGGRRFHYESAWADRDDFRPIVESS